MLLNAETINGAAIQALVGSWQLLVSVASSAGLAAITIWALVSIILV